MALRSLEDNFYGLGLNSCNDNILASLSNARKIKKLIIVIFSSIVFSCSVLCKFCVFFLFFYSRAAVSVVCPPCCSTISGRELFRLPPRRVGTRWQWLPENVVSALTLRSFRHQLKTFLFELSFLHQHSTSQ